MQANKKRKSLNRNVEFGTKKNSVQRCNSSNCNTIYCSANYFKNDKLKKKINKKATQNLSGFLYFLIIETNFDSSLQISKVNS